MAATANDEGTGTTAAEGAGGMKPDDPGAKPPGSDDGPEAAASGEEAAAVVSRAATSEASARAHAEARSTTGDGSHKEDAPIPPAPAGRDHDDAGAVVQPGGAQAAAGFADRVSRVETRLEKLEVRIGGAERQLDILKWLVALVLILQVAALVFLRQILVSLPQ